MAVHLNGLDIRNKLIVAPMAEISDAPFRAICKEHGAGLTFTQMVSADGVVKNNFTTSRYLSFNKSEKPIGVQILGNDPKIIYKAVKEILKFSPDVIDLNCGCPVPHVVSNKMGASVLDDTKLLGELINAMHKAAEGTPVTAKLRLGSCYNDISIIENAKAAEDNGAAFITVHFRTRDGRYYDNPDFELLGELKQRLNIPVIANGSVFTPEAALELIKSYGADGVMVARGVLGNPFLLRRFIKINEGENDPGHPGIEEVIETLMKHLRLLVREFGEFAALDKAKKQTIWYLRFFEGIYLLIDKVLKSRSITQLYDVIEEHKNYVLTYSTPDWNYEDIQEKFKQKVLFWLLEEEQKKLNFQIA